MNYCLVRRIWNRCIMYINDLLLSKTDMERMVPDRKTISSASEMLADSDIKEPDLSIKC